MAKATLEIVLNEGAGSGGPGGGGGGPVPGAGSGGGPVKPAGGGGHKVEPVELTKEEKRKIENDNLYRHYERMEKIDERNKERRFENMGYRAYQEGALDRLSRRLTTALTGREHRAPMYKHDRESGETRSFEWDPQQGKYVPYGEKQKTASPGGAMWDAGLVAAAQVGGPVANTAVNIEVARRAVSSVTKKLMEIGPVAAAAGGSLALLAVEVGAAVVVVKKFVSTLTNEVQRAKQYSPVVAIADAESQIRRFFGEFRRAQRLGPGLARFETTRSKIEESVFEFKTEVLALLLQIFEALKPAIDFVPRIFEALTELLKIIPQMANVLQTFFDGKWKEAAEQMGAVGVTIGKAYNELVKANEKDKDPPLDPAFQALFKVQEDLRANLQVPGVGGFGI